MMVGREPATKNTSTVQLKGRNVQHLVVSTFIIFTKLLRIDRLHCSIDTGALPITFRVEQVKNTWMDLGW